MAADYLHLQSQAAAAAAVLLPHQTFLSLIVLILNFQSDQFCPQQKLNLANWFEHFLNCQVLITEGSSLFHKQQSLLCFCWGNLSSSQPFRHKSAG